MTGMPRIYFALFLHVHKDVGLGQKFVVSPWSEVSSLEEALACTPEPSRGPGAQKHLAPFPTCDIPGTP